jgi:hypothetical protein
LRIVHGDIWDLKFDRYWRVVPTNLGWRHDGRNVMGAGVAKQAAQRFPDLSAWYGKVCQGMARTVIFLASYEPGKLIMFPVKPLDMIQPHLSWRQGASLDLIDEMLVLLADETEQVILPLVGCGNGGLSPELVRPRIEKLLAADNFTLVLA